jgi:hypothetical protein
MGLKLCPSPYGKNTDYRLSMFEIEVPRRLPGPNRAGESSKMIKKTT